MIQNKIDTYKHKGLRKKLIETIKNKGIKDEAVLQAIDKIPRHFFLDLAFDKIAYEDRAFPIGEGQTISQPYTVAYQTELLNIQPREKVLEIGTGSVYQATVLAEMGAQVFTIERQKKLYEKNMISYPFLAKYKNIKFFYGDGYKGLPTYAPFDKIIITAAAPMVPIDLIAQLKPLGVMVLPLGNEEHQTMTRLTKQVDGTLIEEKFENFVFVPMLKGKADH
ncbi:MAG TPA: protein-L-isoaspartate(D-aspartate) O-methyltransferase [Chitinophagaceae bacterium]|jgi:protein-L-isoaspartate(D-aspartate) O-methyltransferase|nr:protein-L-isoaspartate(D-aspartate) O-methyltransferase [Chitinophagaceae bacterium]